MATSTPWGPSQYSTKIANGITVYSTSSHGGIKVSAGRLSDMHPALIAMGWNDMGPKGWFEEDCSWCAVALAFPECFEANTVEVAHEMAKSIFPDLYAKAMQD